VTEYPDGRVGGNEVHHVDVRVIAATNVDIPALAEIGRFHSDLLDRLAFDVVTVPPAREHFGRGMTRELGREVFRGFTAAALARLTAYRWPGNVRELKNVVERSLYRWPRPDAPIDDIVFDAFGSPHRPAMPAAAPPPAPAAEPSAAGDSSAASRRVSGSSSPRRWRRTISTSAAPRLRSASPTTSSATTSRSTRWAR
jgi:psp operon transcriptional activator